MPIPMLLGENEERSCSRRQMMAALARLLLVPVCLALVFLALHLACGNHYGFFRDELYFVACGQRLAWGYVDQPPFIAVMARFAWWLSGGGQSVWLFRLPSYLAGALCILTSALLARRLGGGRFAMALSAAASFGSPLLLAQSHLMAMNIFEILIWELIALTTLIAVNGAESAWVAAGALLGLALTVKYSAGLLSVGLLCGLALTSSRRSFASPWLWVGVTLILLLGLPSLRWQWDHGFPFFELIRNGGLYKNTVIPPLKLLMGALAEQGPVGAGLVFAGCYELLRPRLDDEDHAPLEARFLGVTLLLVLAVFLGHGAKPYYLGPAFPPLFVAGAVLVERKLSWRWARLGLLGFSPSLVIVISPLAIPLLPDSLHALHYMQTLGIAPIRLERTATQDMPQHFADQTGWPERVAAVSHVVDAFTPAERSQMVLFTTNYGRAAALELLGKDLPPVICGHNQYYVWGSPREPQIVVALGGDVALYRALYREVIPCGTTPDLPLGMPYESEIPIYCCRGPRAPVAELLARARHYD